MTDFVAFSGMDLSVEFPHNPTPVAVGKKSEICIQT